MNDARCTCGHRKSEHAMLGLVRPWTTCAGGLLVLGEEDGPGLEIACSCGRFAVANAGDLEAMGAGHEVAS